MDSDKWKLAVPVACTRDEISLRRLARHHAFSKTASRKLDAECLTDFGGGVHEFRTVSTRILGVVWLTDIGSRALAARLYWAVEEASVPVLID